MAYQNYNTANPNDAEHHHLIPFETYRTRWNLWLTLFLAYILVAIIVTAVEISAHQSHYVTVSSSTETRSDIIYLCLASLVALILAIVFNRRLPFTIWMVKSGLRSHISYIQDRRFAKGKYLFYVKNGKFGLFHSKQNRIKIYAQYDSVEWQIKNKVMRVTQDYRSFSVDICGNELR